MKLDWLQTLVAGLLGGGLIGLIEFLIRRHDERNGKMAEILDAINRLEKKIDDVDQKGDEREAINSRIRILRFMDEILEGRKHSKDSYDQVMTDITNYNAYCDSHPHFKNDQTAATVEHIRKNYAERLEKHDFL